MRIEKRLDEKTVPGIKVEVDEECKTESGQWCSDSREPGRCLRETAIM